MTLTTRLTAFYLGTLAVVLIAFSGALYLLAHRHLHAELTTALRAYSTP